MKKILIIDDDIDFREQARVVLEAHNYQVLEAEDGATGLNMIRDQKPDFILLDVMMEEVDTGVKLAENLANLNIKVPVVILSSFASAAAQVFDTSAVPVKDYLQKPLKSDELLALVRKYTQS
ncbi:MAG: response regulator [candidate division KSB1 bacterium]|nr:response regulator [candidate division KSB1 bacterium]MDZ7335555.1 response regulator [candidate division KSB1 bacterium]MDZ7356921.1 response regulator [candidate division KSB1 bacterium]MDZ7375173.1 response regulator [candidate division KSB1 bacterium]MDZ7399248.1 response regulator [candidate division KSB1 bacterium]